MSDHNLLLNETKTEAIIISAPNRKHLQDVTCVSVCRFPKHLLRNSTMHQMLCKYPKQWRLEHLIVENILFTYFVILIIIITVCMGTYNILFSPV